MMLQYAETTSCRRRFILNYFGEDFETDRLRRVRQLLAHDGTRGRRQRSARLPAATRSPTSSPSEVRQGTVERAEKDLVTVLFPSVGYKTLLASAVSRAEAAKSPDLASAKSILVVLLCGAAMCGAVSVSAQSTPEPTPSPFAQPLISPSPSTMRLVNAVPVAIACGTDAQPAPTPTPTLPPISVNPPAAYVPRRRDADTYRSRVRLAT